MTIQEFIEKSGLKLIVRKARTNPNMASDKEWTKTASHYKVIIFNERNEAYETYFSRGSSLTGPPDLPTILNCLASDASGIENAKSFEDWAAEYGYDTDSRKAEKTYQLCQKQAEELKDLLGTDEYETLLWKVERL